MGNYGSGAIQGGDRLLVDCFAFIQQKKKTYTVQKHVVPKLKDVSENPLARKRHQNKSLPSFDDTEITHCERQFTFQPEEGSE